MGEFGETEFAGEAGGDAAEVVLCVGELKSVLEVELWEWGAFGFRYACHWVRGRGVREEEERGTAGGAY